MKSIDSNAIGLLIGQMLETEAAFPIADREAGYEEDNIKTIFSPLTVGADNSKLQIITDNGQRFIVSIEQIN